MEPDPVPEPDLEPEPSPTVEPEPVPVVQESVPAGVRNAAWLLAQPESSYTLQLVSVSSEERVHRFVEQQQNPSDFAWYTVRREDKMLYVITYGLYADVDAARQAAQFMPKEVGNLEPWIRQMKFIQEAARTGL